MRSVLLQLHTGSPTRCESWDNVPVAHGVQVTVYAETAAGGPGVLARRIHAGLERELARLGAHRVNAPCAPGLYHAHTCAGAVAGLAGRVLIFIADGSALIDPTMQTYFGHPGTVIVPIVDRSLSSRPNTVLPPFMRTQLAESTAGFDPRPILPRLLRAAGVVARADRLFISYRHSEAADFAGALFHALAERGFEPFLDRFSSRPGDDFVDLIREELADKSTLILLETASLGQSLYCRQEVATAVSRRMGLIAIDLPGSRLTFKVIAKRIAASSLTPTRAQLMPIVDQIERHTAHEGMRRPRWQDSNLNHAIAAAGLGASPLGLGRYLVQSRSGPRVLAMSPGLPQAKDFIEVDERCNACQVTKAAIFGPLAVARTNRYREIGWLRQKSGLDACDEGQLMRYLGRL